jgi:hypothetical protein
MNDFEKAGAAFEVAQRVAHERAATRSRSAPPRRFPCALPRRRALSATDSTAYAKQAGLFEQVAGRWRSFEHAHLASTAPVSRGSKPADAGRREVDERR